jgi:putative flippase GtrA
MTRQSPRIVTAVRNKLRSTVGKRFSRFAVAAVAAVAASQITLTVCLGVLDLTAGKSALAAWVAGAGTSYMVSRWAWERKGRPDLLKETLPFWLVAIGAAIVLTTVTKFANQWAISMGLTGAQQVLFVDAAFFLANCFTFVTRFVIFHYVLFTDRGLAPPPSGVSAAATPVAGPAESTGFEEPLAASGSGVRLGGSPVWSGTGPERSPARRPAADTGPLPEPGTRR